jgi:nucleoside-diphosphate-sugar epimerase
MKALFIGGSGLISSAVSRLAIDRGWELTLVNRGLRPEFTPANAKTVTLNLADDYSELKSAIGGETYDVVVQWIAFHPDRVERDVDLFLGRTRQYIFISSGAAYERPMRRHIVTEDLPLNNHYWQYGRDKRMCEEACMSAYRGRGFPATIVRPSLTYGLTQIPFAMGSWRYPWSLCQRILDGKPIGSHGDGLSLWQMTHNSDFAKGFVGLMGRDQAIGDRKSVV